MDKKEVNKADGEGKMRGSEYAWISSSLITKYQKISYRYNKSSNHGIDIFKDIKVTLIKNNTVNKKYLMAK